MTLRFLDYGVEAAVELLRRIDLGRDLAVLLEQVGQLLLGGGHITGKLDEARYADLLGDERPPERD